MTITLDQLLRLTQSCHHAEQTAPSLSRGFHLSRASHNRVLTVCSLRRSRWLANPIVERHLIESWKLATAWLVGRYVLMPDHLHLVCSPIEETVEIETWVTFWKRRFRRMHGHTAQRFQPGCFHHRLRQQESYDQRWDYIRENPVRAGLVKRAEDWPFTGDLNELRW